LHGEKEEFEEYSLFLEYAELSFAILINYSTEKNRTCPRATVLVTSECFCILKASAKILGIFFFLEKYDFT
jgi:hypothetical protein